MATDLPSLGKHNLKRETSTPDELALAVISENPFKLPADDKIFRLREQAKINKQKTKEDNAKLPVWDKNNAEVLSRTQRIKDLMGDTKITTVTEANQNGLDESIKIIAPRHQEKENMTDFVAKKREMFLVQMSLDTKREEIRKLEEKAQMKEEALQRSEQMLEEDAMRFDAFLKENDKKAHDAIKKGNLY